MNYYSLPEEIWVSIFSLLRYRDAKNLSMISSRFNKLYKDGNIVEKIKMRGFPRVSGYCESHDVHKFAGHYDDVSSASIHDLLVYSNYIFDIKEFGRLQNLILDELYGTDVNLVRGDMIFLDERSNTGIYIFDGLNMIELDYKINNDGFLPDEFTVINNNVPIDYWNKSIGNYQQFWFDHQLVKKQCIDNISCIKMDDVDYVFTNFNYNDINYSIVDYCKNEVIESKLNRFLLLFTSDNKLLLNNIITYGPLYNEIIKLIPNTKIIRIKLDHWRNYAICI